VLGDRRPDGHQRLRRPVRDQIPARCLEGVRQVVIATHRDAEERIAERRRTDAAGAIAAAHIAGRRRNDHGFVVFQRVDPRTGLTRRHDDDPPADGRGIEQLPQSLRR
jgi:hypothetical protein